jgi:hypothetical protein
MQTKILKPPLGECGKRGKGGVGVLPERERQGEKKTKKQEKIPASFKIGAWGRGCPESQKGHATPGASLGRKGHVPFTGAIATRRELNGLFGHGLSGEGGNPQTQLDNPRPFGLGNWV